ncbi:hypothetical protein GT347_16150 [Xylophilus rhododendri]|uniref:Uncharacterized protein n=1 Tax=Xylophilus rhododendri TaxID=2697032 RepID=A0A857J6D0_9BURK|nr:hypothetical protein [Xylophilus rhododendri]QHI99376.1 hypothetical protein GT347_16150 [Xylophilus rhododendri]
MTAARAVLLALLGMALAFAAGTWYGTGLGEDREYAKRAREDAIVDKAGQAAQLAAAKAIAANKPRNVTIRQETEREIQTRTVYADCRHSPDQMQRLNEALTGRAEPAGVSQLPGLGAAYRR